MMDKKIKKVLLVEDDPAIIDIYKIMMKKDHLSVEVISLGQEAIERIKSIAIGEQSKPDIILLDLTHVLSQKELIKTSEIVHQLANITEKAVKDSPKINVTPSKRKKK